MYNNESYNGFKIANVKDLGKRGVLEMVHACHHLQFENCTNNKSSLYQAMFGIFLNVKYNYV
ncbi:MAG TPA: hypothetical protein VFR61_05550, partial [Nitrososphaeraceae archaeon]|nr:hypothetical protein [Nitrososphaeraceae archaeon]